MKVRLLVFSVLLFALTGCSITKSVEPIKAPVSQVCVLDNPKVLMKEFQPELQRQIEEKGFPTKVYTGSRPDDCSHHLEYTANWYWDMAMYLTYAEMRVYDLRGLAGKAVYDARRGSGRLDKFGRTAEKIRPLVDELFGSATKAPIAVQPRTWESVVDSQKDTAARLRELDTLKQQGLVTEDEYARKREAILGEI